MPKEIKILQRPDCDLCEEKTPAHYDAVTKFGVWAYLCSECFFKFTYGKLGTGIGQRLILKEK